MRFLETFEVVKKFKWTLSLSLSLSPRGNFISVLCVRLLIREVG